MTWAAKEALGVLWGGVGLWGGLIGVRLRKSLATGSATGREGTVLNWPAPAFGIIRGARSDATSTDPSAFVAAQAAQHSPLVEHAMHLLTSTDALQRLPPRQAPLSHSEWLLQYVLSSAFTATLQLQQEGPRVESCA